MGPSSLVFVAIVVVWAAYLVPHWVRRRESLAEGRTKDRFSEQARVLDRRQGGGRTHTDRPSSLPLHRTSPVSRATVAAGYAADDAMPSSARQPRVDGQLSRHAAGSAETRVPARRPAAHAHRGRRRTPSRPPERPPARPGPPPRRVPSRIAARRRVAVLLVLTGISGLFWALAATTAVAWWTALPTTVLLALDVALLRMSAQARAADRVREAAEARRRQASAAAGAGRARASALGSGAAAEASGMPTAEIPVVADDGTWTPVPVPPPTYTLKPPAPRPTPPPPTAQEEQARSVHEQVVEAGLLPEAAGGGAGGVAAGSSGGSAPAAVTGSAAVPGGRFDVGATVARVPGTVSGGPGAAPGRPGEVARTEGDRAVDEFDLDGVLERRRAVNG